MAGVPVYKGEFGEAEATRLLWRAGFGPKPGRGGEARASLQAEGRGPLADPSARRRRSSRGPTPVDDDGLPIAPFDAWGHDLLWWLDRMVRTNHPLVERMALIWHDWFATADVSSERLSIEQAQLFEQQGLGSFHDLLLAVTDQPGDAVWLSGIENTKRAPNENYGRELMELFTLGASDASGYPYSEDDVREQARALTGWRATWVDDVGPTNFRFDATRHDTGTKTIFGQTGAFDWTDSCRLCVEPRRAQGVLRRQALELLHPDAAAGEDARGADAISTSQREYAIRPVVEAILMHPDFYEGPAMVKPPIVYIAGPAARAPARDRDRVGLDRRARRPAPVPPAERRRLGRDPLARHLDLPRPLDRRQRGRRLRQRSIPRPTTRPTRPPSSRSTGRCASGATRRSATRPASRSSATPTPSPPPRRPIGSRRRSARCARTPCGC